MHRTVSALIEARRFAARHAVMLVHSFGERDESFADYERFAAMLGADAERDELVAACVPGDIP
jgi:hypothetical protein